VLAASAIETRIDDALRSHAQQHGDPALELWSWLTNRDQWWREPSFAEKLSVVLAALASRTLKDDNDLWKAFRNLREARNKYVHEGIASIADQPVTAERAGALLAKARSILDWIEDGLPKAVRRPRFERQHNLEYVIPLLLPEPPPEQSSPGP